MTRHQLLVSTTDDGFWTSIELFTNIKIVTS